MKRFFLILLLFCCSNISLAEQTTSEPAKVIGQRYIRDYLTVPVRSGQSSAYRIVHRGVRSGTKVSLLETNSESGYSLIRLADNIEGWIESQYLQEKPTAELLLEEANRTIARLSQSSGNIGAQLIALEKEHATVKQQRDELAANLDETSKELARIQTLSSNAISLDEENKRLLKELEQAKNQLDTLKADNVRLNDTIKRNEFMNGAFAVLLGIIATLVIQYFQRTRRRSDWA